jgi:hypothetical protein
MVLADENVREALDTRSSCCSKTDFNTFNQMDHGSDIPGFFDTAPFYKRQFHGGVWEVGFTNFVGLSRIGALRIDIQNKKISNSMYMAMLDELAEQYAGLVFSFSTPAGQHYSKSGTGRDPACIEYLFLKNSVHHFLAHNMWQDVGIMQFVPVNSQVLQKKEGYRQLFSLYSLLQLATRCDFLQTDFKNLIEIKDVPTLYEYWCFFQIKSIMDTFSTPAAIDRLVFENPVEHKLTPGLCITYQDGMELFFNKGYTGSSGVDDPDAAMQSYRTGPSYSHTFIPDIVVEKAGKKLIFDAKYKGIKGSGGFYGGDDDSLVWTWKPEDINKMHTYREAITDVTGSFVLFPGAASIIYPKNGPDTMFEGVGAFCLRPDSADSPDSTTRKHIRTLLSDFLMSAWGRKGEPKHN